MPLPALDPVPISPCLTSRTPVRLFVLYLWVFEILVFLLERSSHLYTFAEQVRSVFQAQLGHWFVETFPDAQVQARCRCLVLPHLLSTTLLREFFPQAWPKTCVSSSLDWKYPEGLPVHSQGQHNAWCICSIKICSMDGTIKIDHWMGGWMDG